MTSRIAGGRGSGPRRKLNGPLGLHDEASDDRAGAAEDAAAGRAKKIADELHDDRVLAEVVAADLAEDRILASGIASDLKNAHRRNARFERALFVMFLVTGALAAFAFINARDANDALKVSQAELEIALEQNSDLLDLVGQLQSQITRNDLEARSSRERLESRSRGLEALLVTLLANSNDPEVRAAFERLTAENAAAAMPQPSPQAAPRPRSTTGGSPGSGDAQTPASGAPSPRTTPSASASPASSALPVPLPVPIPCVRPLCTLN